MKAPTILIVEDSADLRDLFAVTLRSSGYEVETADDGMIALQMIDAKPPDAVVLDLSLRTLDGRSVLSELAANGATKDIPVVIVTGAPDELSGVNVAAVLRKPITTDLLVAAIKNALASDKRSH